MAAGRDRQAEGGDRVTVTSGQNQDCLLQGQQSARCARQHLVHVLGVHLPSSRGIEQAERRQVHLLPACDESGKLVEKSREVRSWRLHRRPNDTLADLARAINPFVRGWMSYWGRFYRTEMDVLLKRINTYLMRWARKKYKRLRGFKRLKAWWGRVVNRDPDLFAHWAWTHRFQPTGW